jgi:hypothetical protein
VLSCSPNAILRWNYASFSMNLHVIRDIPKGEEITIPYIDILSPREQRTSRTESVYGFKCQCTKCSAEGKAKQRQADKRIQKVQEWLANPGHTFARWYADSSRQDSGNEYEDLLINRVKAFEAEGLFGLRTEHMQLVDSLARMFGALGKVDKFKESLDKAIQVWQVDSVWSDAARKRIKLYEAWKDDTESFPYWGKRAELVKGK